ncbi:hypothetical protein ACFONC_03395, partial [Luteimonas soli]
EQPQQQEQKPALASSKAWEGKGRILFPLGQLVGTPAALDLLARAGVNGMALVDRHMRGDFGDLDPEDEQSNREAIAHGFRVLSSYPVGTGKVWIITEADRSVTTILLPSDY